MLGDCLGNGSNHKCWSNSCISQAELLVVQEGSCKHPYQQAGLVTPGPPSQGCLFWSQLSLAFWDL